MASTFSSLLRIELIGTGDQSGTWGNTTNTNLGTLIEQAIAGTATVDVSAGNVTLSEVNGSTDQSRCAAIRVIGTPGTARNIIAPALSHIYVIANGSDSTVTIKTSTSTGVAVPTGEVYLVYYDPNVAVADFRLVGRAARSTNTANTLVLRDGSGNFAANVITANDFVGDLTGNVAGSHNGPTGNVLPNTGAFTTLSSSGNTTLGDASGDTLTVNATPTFNVAIPVGSGGTGATTITGLVKGNGTSAFTAAVSSVDYAPATTGTSAQLIANNGTGGFNNVTLDSSLQYTGGTLSVVSGGGMVYPGAGIPLSSGSSWSTSFNNTTNPISSSYGGTGLTTFTAANNAIYSTSASTLTAGTLPVLAGGTGSTTASGARTNLGATTVGGNFFTLTNPGAITFPRINADNTVSALNAADFRTAIGVGTGSGTVTSITAGSFLTGGTITTSGTIAVDATNLNTASTVVARDASGNFAAGTITASLTGNATSATTASNLAGGGAGQVPYNTAAGTTAFLAAGSANQVLQSNGTAAPSWVTSVNSATNIAGGGAGRIPYNTGSGTTVFTAAGTSGQVLQSNGTSAPTWTDAPGMTFLGTITTTSGTSANITGLTLTTYKQIQFVFTQLSTTSTASVLRITDPSSTALQVGQFSTDSAANFMSGIMTLDLATGVISSSITRAAGATPSTQDGQVFAGCSTFSTSTTSFTFTLNTGNFDAGSIRVYGIR